MIKITAVYLSAPDTVACLDSQGERVEGFCGPLGEVGDALAAFCTRETKYIVMMPHRDREITCVQFGVILAGAVERWEQQAKRPAKDLPCPLTGFHVPGCKHRAM